MIPGVAEIKAETWTHSGPSKQEEGGLVENKKVVVESSAEDFGAVVMDLVLSFSFTEKTIPNVIISHRYKAQDTPARKTFEQALTGAFMSAVIKDLRPSALPFVASLIRHYTMVAVAQQCGEWPRGSGASKTWSGHCGISERLSLGDWVLSFVNCPLNNHWKR